MVFKNMTFVFQAFVTYFSLALEFEYRDSGITVQTVQPGIVATNMTSYSKHFSKPGQS